MRDGWLSDDEVVEFTAEMRVPIVFDFVVCSPW